MHHLASASYSQVINLQFLTIIHPVSSKYAGKYLPNMLEKLLQSNYRSLIYNSCDLQYGGIKVGAALNEQPNLSNWIYYINPQTAISYPPSLYIV
jgi:hypothetical protein